MQVCWESQTITENQVVQTLYESECNITEAMRQIAQQDLIQLGSSLRAALEANEYRAVDLFRRFEKLRVAIPEHDPPISTDRDIWRLLYSNAE